MERYLFTHYLRKCSAHISFAGLLMFLTGCASFVEFNASDHPPDLTPTSGSSSTGSTGNENSASSTTADLNSRNLDLKICKMRVSNPPAAINRQVSRKSSTACVNGVQLLIAPAPGACLTSGFGLRNGKQHKGIDYQSKPAGDVIAAAPGKVLIKGYRAKDFGNWVVLDHGSGVYTAYSHLATIDEQVREEAVLKQGDKLGVMGKSGPSWITAIHLHYEVRVGDMKSAGSFFKLTPVDPFKLPASCPAS